ncbi:class I SAM-dependent methyltransferase [Streptacidiphilus monticola]
MLWTLWFRAAEARRPDTVLADPEAVRAVERTDFPFRERFGPPHELMAQQMALRAAAFDAVTREFLDAYPEGTVVALGEGLETSYWRVDNGRLHWLTVDLPESLALRTRVLPAAPRQRTLACDARDPRWLDGLDPDAGVLVTAEGLFMYLRPAEVRDLIRACAERLPGGGLVFDAVPRWFAARSRRQQLRMPTGWTAPPMPWGMDADQRPALRRVHPAVAEVREVPLPPGRGCSGDGWRPGRRGRRSWGGCGPR